MILPVDSPTKVTNPIDMLLTGSIFYFFIKFFSYSFFGKLLNTRFQTNRNIYIFGLARTLIGMVFGALILLPVANVLGLGGTSFRNPGNDYPLFFAILILLRLFEWGFVIYLFYNKQPRYNFEWKKAVLGGTALSFFLDLTIYLGLFAII